MITLKHQQLSDTNEQYSEEWLLACSASLFLAHRIIFLWKPMVCSRFFLNAKTEKICLKPTTFRLKSNYDKKNYVRIINL